MTNLTTADAFRLPIHVSISKNGSNKVSSLKNTTTTVSVVVIVLKWSRLYDAYGSRPDLTIVSVRSKPTIYIWHVRHLRDILRTEKHYLRNKLVIGKNFLDDDSWPIFLNATTQMVRFSDGKSYNFCQLSS